MKDAGILALIEDGVKRMRNIILTVLGVALVGAAAWFGYKKYQESKTEGENA